MSKVIRKRVSKKKIIIGIISLVLFISLIIFLVIELTKEKKIFMINAVGNDINEVKKTLDEYKLDINIEYEYNNKVKKDNVISQSIKEETEIHEGDKLELLVSLGARDVTVYKKDGINELGKVPIMMYHGIVDKKNSETDYTGGNVDKDGYTRTAEAFRNDLEFYYSEGYRMIKLSDYIDGKIDVKYGYSPIILTFDDGNANNIKVTGVDGNGDIIIDKNSAVGILEEFKKKYPDYNVTAIFFVTNALFNQPEYNERILRWLVENGYEVGNHTYGHNNLSKIGTSETQKVIGSMYQTLDNILKDKYSKIVALPFGSPYDKGHANYQYVLSGEYNGYKYETKAALRVGWEPEVSPFDNSFDATFLKRCRAYDNNGVDFDIQMVFKMLSTTRYVSDGDVNTVVTSKVNEKIINKNVIKEIVLYE